MSPQMKGLVGVVLAVVSLWSRVVVEMVNLPSNIYTVLVIPLIISLIALHLGVQARKDGAKIWGLIGIVIAVIAIISQGYSLFAIALYKLS